MVSLGCDSQGVAYGEVTLRQSQDSVCRSKNTFMVPTALERGRWAMKFDSLACVLLTCSCRYCSPTVSFKVEHQVREVLNRI